MERPEDREPKELREEDVTADDALDERAREPLPGESDGDRDTPPPQGSNS